MASVTRSSRRAEGLHPHPHHHANSVLHPTAGGRGRNSSGTKRGLDTVDRGDFDAFKPKRTRIAVEILSKGAHPARADDPAVAAAAAGAAKVPQPPPLAAAAPPRPPRSAVATGKPPKQTPIATTTPHTTTTATTPKPPHTNASAAAEDDPNITKHQAKVINGIKHELDRLQPEPQSKDKREGGRKLRSQEATRFKSELSAYFPEYDEVIGNEPKEQHLLNVDTPIVVVDLDPRRALPAAQRFAAQHPHHQTPQYPVRGYGDALFNDVYDAQRIDFSFLEAQFKNRALEDPLPDKVFHPVHRRAERLERTIRNTEKGRAQHEKDQIIRLLEGLQGHDWLRVMGVSGITESKKKAFEPAREHFIKGCQAILTKFRNWILEEKRRKQEKERALAERAEEEAEEKAQASTPTDEQHDDEDVPHDDSSDSASPAKQLREEALARSKASAKGSKRQRSTSQPATAKPPKPPKPPEPPKEFTSFFTKKYERDGALNRHRRAGRKVLAWGHPIPDIPQADFELPHDFLDEETLKARARKKRRDKRGSRS